MPDDDLVPSLLALSDVMATGWHAAVAAGVRAGRHRGRGRRRRGRPVRRARRLPAGRRAVVAMSRHEPRQELATRFGATDVVAERGEEGEAAVAEITGGVGADAVLECVGTDAAVQHRVRRRPARLDGRLRRRAARRGAAGAPDVPEERRPRRRHGAGAPLPARAARAGRWPGAIEPGLVFDLTLPLDEVAEGYRAMDERRAIKVLLQP